MNIDDLRKLFMESFTGGATGEPGRGNLPKDLKKAKLSDFFDSDNFFYEEMAENPKSGNRMRTAYFKPSGEDAEVTMQISSPQRARVPLPEAVEEDDSMFPPFVVPPARVGGRPPLRTIGSYPRLEAPRTSLPRTGTVSRINPVDRRMRMPGGVSRPPISLSYERRGPAPRLGPMYRPSALPAPGGPSGSMIYNMAGRMGKGLLKAIPGIGIADLMLRSSPAEASTVAPGTPYYSGPGFEQMTPEQQIEMDNMFSTEPSAPRAPYLGDGLYGEGVVGMDEATLPYYPEPNQGMPDIDTGQRTGVYQIPTPDDAEMIGLDGATMLPYRESLIEHYMRGMPKQDEEDYYMMMGA